MGEPDVSSRMAMQAEERRNVATAAKLLKQIAKEVGRAYGSADLAAIVPPVQLDYTHDPWAAILSETYERLLAGRYRLVKKDES